MVDEIRLMLRDGVLAIDVNGNLAAMLTRPVRPRIDCCRGGTLDPCVMRADCDRALHLMHLDASAPSRIHRRTILPNLSD